MRGGGITLSERKNGNLETISGSSGSSSSDVEYYKTPMGAERAEYIALYKNKTTSGIYISGLNEEYTYQTVAIAYAPISNQGIIYYSLKDFFKSQLSDMSDEEFETLFNSLFTPITKEEFYDLNNI